MRYVIGQGLLFVVLAVAAATGAGPWLWRGSGAGLLAGVVSWVIAAVMALLALATLGRSFRVAPEPGAEARLVTSGIYGRLRHPMYTAVATASLGLVLARPTVAVAAAAAGLVLLLVSKARHEETLLRARHPEYESYRARTRGVLPFSRG